MKTLAVILILFLQNVVGTDDVACDSPYVRIDRDRPLDLIYGEDAVKISWRIEDNWECVDSFAVEYKEALAHGNVNEDRTNYRNLTDDESESDGQGQYNATILYREMIDFFGITESTPIAPLELTVYYQHVHRDRRRRPQIVGRAKFRLGLCNGEQPQYTRFVRPVVRQLSYDSKESTGVVEVSWQPPSCNADRVVGYVVTAWNEDSSNGNELYRTESASKSATSATITLRLKTLYSIQVLAQGSRGFAATEMIKYRTHDCGKGVRRLPSLRFGETSAEDGKPVKAKLQLKWGPGGGVPSRRDLDNDCLKGFVVAYWPGGYDKNRKSPRMTSILPRDQVELDVEIVPNVAYDFQLLAVVVGEGKEGAVNLQPAGREPKTVKLTADGFCSKNMRDEPEMAALPTVKIDTIESGGMGGGIPASLDLDGDGIADDYEADSDGDGIPDMVDNDDDNDGVADADEPVYGNFGGGPGRAMKTHEVTVSWDPANITKASCVEGVFVRIWTVNQESRYETKIQVSSQTVGADESSAMFMLQDWNFWGMEDGRTVYAQAIPLTAGQSFQTCEARTFRRYDSDGDGPGGERSCKSWAGGVGPGEDPVEYESRVAQAVVGLEK